MGNQGCCTSANKVSKSDKRFTKINQVNTATEEVEEKDQISGHNDSKLSMSRDANSLNFSRNSTQRDAHESHKKRESELDAFVRNVHH